jgi:DNA polymerase-1
LSRTYGSDMAFDDDLHDYQGNYGRVFSLDGVKRLVDHLVSSGDTVAFDIETGYTGQDKRKASLDVYFPYQFVVGFSITNSTEWARYVPLLHDFGENLDPHEVWPVMKPLLETVQVVCHNWVFESRNMRALDLKGHGPRIEMPWENAWDTMIQSYVLSETPQHGLKELSQAHYNYEQAEIHSLFEKKLTEEQQKCIRFNPLPISPEVINYACDDVTWSLRLDQDGREKCLTERKFIYTLEREIQGILIDMADVGVSVDWDGIATGLSQFEFFYQAMENLTRRLFEEASGRDLTTLNFRSAPQMRQLLFEDLGLTPARMTKPNKSGKQSASTDETSLEILRKQHPAVDQLLKYRQTKKMGEWFELWSTLRTSYDEKVHPSLNQIRVQSGRFASDSPNVQNITKKWWFASRVRDFSEFPSTKDGDAAWEAHLKQTGVNGIDYWTGNARDYLVASPGYRLLTFDYRTAEMRVLAGLAQEPHLLNAFENKIDVHVTAASLAFGVSLEQIDKDHPLRQRAKAVNFGLIYGQGVQGLADGLGIPKDEAQKIMDQYFAAFSKVDQWFTKVKRDAHDHGYVESFMGRKSTLWELQSPNKAVRSKADRLAVNIPVQGGAADYCKVAMVRAQRALVKAGWWKTKVRMLMNQHDSLVFEVADDLSLTEVIDLLEPAVSFPIKGFPLMEVDWETGLRWGSVTKYVPGDPEEVSEVSVAESETDDLEIDLPEELLITFSDIPTEDQVQEVISVLKSAPGTIPVVFCVSGQEHLSRGKVSSEIPLDLLTDLAKAHFRQAVLSMEA